MFVSLICYIIIVINHFVYTPSSRVIYNCFSFVFFRTLYSGIRFFLPIKNGRPVMSARAFFISRQFFPSQKRSACHVMWPQRKPTRARALREEIIPIKVSCSLRVQVYNNTAALSLNLLCTVNWILRKNNSAVTMKVLITFTFQRTSVCNAGAKAYTPWNINKTPFNA